MQIDFAIINWYHLALERNETSDASNLLRNSRLAKENRRSCREPEAVFLSTDWRWGELGDGSAKRLAFIKSASGKMGD